MKHLVTRSCQYFVNILLMNYYGIFSIYLDCIFSRSLAKPKSEMTPEELAKREEEEFNTGPLSVLTQSVRNNTQVSLYYYNRFMFPFCKNAK